MGVALDRLEEHVAVVAREEVLDLRRIRARPAPNRRQVHAIRGHFTRCDQLFAERRVFAPVLPGVTELQHRAVGQLHERRTVDVRDVRVDRVREPDELEAAVGQERTRFDRAACRIGLVTRGRTPTEDRSIGGLREVLGQRVQRVLVARTCRQRAAQDRRAVPREEHAAAVAVPAGALVDLELTLDCGCKGVRVGRGLQELAHALQAREGGRVVDARLREEARGVAATSPVERALERSQHLRPVAPGRAQVWPRLARAQGQQGGRPRGQRAGVVDTDLLLAADGRVDAATGRG